MSHLKLLYNPLSPPCRFVLMVTDAINLNVHLEEVDILTKKYINRISQINPQHTIPTLQDSDLTLWESHAIAPYLVSNYSNDDTLYPKNRKLRAVIDQRLHFDSGILYPILKKVVRPILFKNYFGISNSDVKDIESSYKFTDQFLEDSEWLCGDKMTLADLSCVSTLSTLDLLYPVSEKRYQNLYAFLKKCEDLPCYGKHNLIGLDRLAKEIHNRLVFSNNLRRKV